MKTKVFKFYKNGIPVENRETLDYLYDEYISKFYIQPSFSGVLEGYKVGFIMELIAQNDSAINEVMPINYEAIEINE